MGRRERERERAREHKRIDLLFHLFITHSLILVCALTGDQTCNLGISGQHSDQLSYSARDLTPLTWVIIESTKQINPAYNQKLSCSYSIMLWSAFDIFKLLRVRLGQYCLEVLRKVWGSLGVLRRTEHKRVREWNHPLWIYWRKQRYSEQEVMVWATAEILLWGPAWQCLLRQKCVVVVSKLPNTGVLQPRARALVLCRFWKLSIFNRALLLALRGGPTCFESLVVPQRSIF